MNLRWLLFDYSDPDLPLSFWKRAKLAWRRVPLRTLPSSMHRGRFVCTFGVIMLPVVVFVPLFNLAVAQVELFSSGVGLFVLLLLFVPTAWIWGCLLYGLVSRPEHYYRIRLEGFDICLKCGYWLRGLGDEITNCPECGTKRESMPEPAVEAGSDDQREEGPGRRAQ